MKFKYKGYEINLSKHKYKTKKGFRVYHVEIAINERVIYQSLVEVANLLKAMFTAKKIVDYGDEKGFYDPYDILQMKMKKGGG